MKVEIGPYEDNDSRKVEIQIDDYDLWNLDHTLSLIILESLKKFKIDLPSHPCLKNPDECHIDCGCSQNWKDMIDEMVWSFEQIVNQDDMVLEMSKDRDSWREYEDKIQHGLNLFGQYFRSLWT